jgi:glucose/arabinose dehydrogenase
MPSVVPPSVRCLLVLLCVGWTAHEAALAATLPAGYGETVVADHLGAPTAMALAPDGRIFVCEQSGDLRVIRDGALLAEPFVHLAVDDDGERGLLGVTFDPAFASNGFVYVYYTVPAGARHNRISRFTADGDRAAPGSEVVLFDLDNLSGATNHNGGALHFGPDGKLYVAVGENANPANAPSLGTLLGKILRLNSNGSIPPDNPFLGQASGRDRAIWARGLRNPFTFAFDTGNGGSNRLYINDVGQETFEEIDLGAAGANYGWPSSEGPTDAAGATGPLYWYGHDEGCAITGGTFYRPETPQFPVEWVGQYFFADYCGGWVRRFDPASATAVGFGSDFVAPVDLATAPDGSLLVLEYEGGRLLRITGPAGEAPRITTPPSSQTVAVGEDAAWSVAASGAQPLTYRWRRNGAPIAGATAANYTRTAVTVDDDGALFDVVVRNDFGQATSAAATLHVTSDTPPTPYILTPAAGTRYRGGQTFSFSGSAEDAEDGALPASALTWQVVFHHAGHTHPFMPPTSGVDAGSFTIPVSGETSADVFFRLELTVRDSQGLTASSFVDLLPQTVRLTLASAPAGLALALDGQPVTASHTVTAVVGVQRSVGVTSPQGLGGVTYTFAGWSDGGAASHTVTTPEVDTTYTASFAASAAPVGLGLTGAYYPRPDLTGVPRLRVDPGVAFDWGDAAPIGGIPADRFSVRWSGQLEAPVSGQYTFTTISDDGVRLFVDGRRVIDQWNDHPEQEDQGRIRLVAGRRYDLRLEVYESYGLAVAKLLWQAPGLPRSLVPASRLFPYALLVTGTDATAPSAADAAVRDRLAQLGFAPVVTSAAVTRTGDAVGKAVVLVSGSVSPAAAALATALRATPTPLVSWQPELADELGLTAAGDGDGGATAPVRRLRLVSAHPLAAGLVGGQTVTNGPSSLSFGLPAAASNVAAREIGGAARPLVFGYERKALMVGLRAPARRVGLFLGPDTATALTIPGWRLVDASIRWAAGVD